MRKITECQAKIIIFIENFIQRNSYSPTLREIAEHFQMSPKGAHDHVIALVKKEYLSIQYKKPRTIRIIGKKQGDKA